MVVGALLAKNPQASDTPTSKIFLTLLCGRAVSHEAPQVCTLVITHVSRALTGGAGRASGAAGTLLDTVELIIAEFAHKMRPFTQDEAPRILRDLHVGRGGPVLSQTITQICLMFLLYP